MTTGVDYAWGRPTPAGIKAAGHTFVCRYLSKDAKKNLSPAEAKALLVGGLDIVVVWETTANRAGQGGGAGAIDGAEAKRQAEACGAPASSPIFFAVDYDAQPTDFARIGAYAKAFGANVAPHPVGVYGSLAVCAEMLRVGVASYAWQTVAWSRGKRLASAHIYQRLGQVTIDGVACDVNEALKADFGGWKSSLPGTYPAPHDQEIDVTLDELMHALGIGKTLDGSRYLTLDEVIGFAVEREVKNNAEGGLGWMANNINSHFSRIGPDGYK